MDYDEQAEFPFWLYQDRYDAWWLAQFGIHPQSPQAQFLIHGRYLHDPDGAEEALFNVCMAL